MAVPAKYRGIVGAAAKAAGAIGVPGAVSFGLDVTVMGTIWAAMIFAVAERSRHRVNKVYAIKVGSGVVAGISAYIIGSKIAMKILHALPVAGTLAAMGVNATLNFLFTYKVGHAVTRLFDKSSFDFDDAEATVKTILRLAAGLPTFSEAGDMIELVSEPIERKTFQEFVADITAERNRRGL